MSLDGNLSGVSNGRWTKLTAIGLEVRESMRKHVVGLSEARDIVERGTEGGMSRENVELRKLTMILVLYGAGAEVDVKTGLVLKTVYPVSKLTFKSTRGTVLY